MSDEESSHNNNSVCLEENGILSNKEIAIISSNHSINCAVIKLRVKKFHKYKESPSNNHFKNCKEKSHEKRM